MTAGTGAHVVIVGGGYAGPPCARKVAATDGVVVAPIDKNDYHQLARTPRCGGLWP
jgi:NADH dehydrogenase FAD-containing subunit